MSTLFNVLFAWKCANTHHKLVMDALNQSRSEQAENWRNLCLSLIDPYLQGSKAPDNDFKDFRNHVLHVRENNWGGSINAANQWYTAVLDGLRARKWKDAVYAAGVLSHYFMDPFMPLHTGQTEAESIIHRACEWSIACSYQELTDILTQDLGGWPDVAIPTGDDWLSQMILTGAQTANLHYEACLEHYDLNRGVKNPPAGLDQELKDRIARLIGLSAVGFARVMDRALVESQVVLPVTNLTLQSVLATLQIPIMWVTKKMKDAKERAIVEAAYREFQQTGKVIDALTQDDKTVRVLHANEVLQTPVSVLDRQTPTPVGQAHGTGSAARPTRGPIVQPVPAAVSRQPVIRPATASQESVATVPVRTEVAKKTKLRFYLDVSMPVEKAPSIGATMAKRLEAQGIVTVQDLLNANPAKLAVKMSDARVTDKIIKDWQTQATLCCTVPCLRGHDAQILTACGIHTRRELAVCEASALLKRVEPFAQSTAGQRILRGGETPDLDEVTDWISWANDGNQSAAA